MTEHVKEVNEGNFAELVLQSETPALVDFWAAWCGPCRALAPVVEAVAERYGRTAHFFKLNVDDSPAVAKRYGIQGIPTLILFQGGVEKERILGAVTQENIWRTVDRYTKKSLNEERSQIL
jgi:thioredoxin 1